MVARGERRLEELEKSDFSVSKGRRKSSGEEASCEDGEKKDGSLSDPSPPSKWVKVSSTSSASLAAAAASSSSSSASLDVMETDASSSSSSSSSSFSAALSLDTSVVPKDELHELGALQIEQLHIKNELQRQRLLIDQLQSGMLTLPLLSRATTEQYYDSRRLCHSIVVRVGVKIIDGCRFELSRSETLQPQQEGDVIQLSAGLKKRITRAGNANRKPNWNSNVTVKYGIHAMQSDGSKKYAFGSTYTYAFSQWGAHVKVFQEALSSMSEGEKAEFECTAAYCFNPSYLPSYSTTYGITAASMIFIELELVSFTA